MPTIVLKEVGVVYSEGKTPMWLQAFVLEDGDIEFAFLPAATEEEAQRIGEEYGHLVYSERLMSVFSRAKMLTEIDKRFGMS